MQCIKVKSETMPSETVQKYSLKEATKQTRIIFTSLGLWSLMTKNTSIIEQRLSILLHSICQGVLAFVILPSFLHLFYFEKNFKVKIALFGPVGVAVGCALKYCAIIWQRRKIVECISQMEDDWNQMQSADHGIMIKNVEIGKKLTTVCATFMYAGGISHQIMAPFLPGSIISIVDNSTKRPLIYPVYDTIFDTQVTPVYEIVYLSHVLMGVVVCSMTTGTCNLGAVFVAHISGQNQRMIMKLNNLTSIKNDTEKLLNKKMSEIIELHNRIIKFSFDIEHVLREICMITVLESIYFICMAEYYSMTAWKNNEKFGTGIYFILVEAFTFNCFIFCHIGELLKEQFRAADQAVYMTKWHSLPLKNAKALVLLMAVTQHPPRITAGGLMELSYKGFISVIQTSVTYFNILRMIEF